MKRIMILLVAMAAIAVGYALAFPTYTYKYKITVTLSTANGDVSSSAVREVSYQHQPAILPDATSVTPRYKGQAVVLKLPDGRYAFSLVSDNEFLLIQAAFGDDKNSTLQTASNDRSSHILEPLRGSTPGQSGFPALVMFADVRNPLSLVVLSPRDHDMIPDPRLKVKVKSITVAMAPNQPVTNDIDRVLPWLSAVKGKYLDGGSIGAGDPSNPKHYHAGNFKTGELR